MAKSVSWLAILAVAALAGCAAQQARNDAMMANARAACLAAGFQPGTNELAQCTINGYRQAQARPAPVYGIPYHPQPSPPSTTTTCTSSYGTLVCNTQ